jgi:hypothetical protein
MSRAVGPVDPVDPGLPPGRGGPRRVAGRTSPRDNGIGVEVEDAGEEAGPAGADGGAGEERGGVLVGAYGCLLGWSFGRPLFGVGCVAVVAAEGDDPGTEPGDGGEDAVVAVAVDPRRRDQTGKGAEKFEGRQGENGAAARGGAGGRVEDPADPLCTGSSRSARYRSVGQVPWRLEAEVWEAIDR